MNETCPFPPRRGYVRHDGFVFAAYQKNRSGTGRHAKFLSPEKWTLFLSRQKQYGMENWRKAHQKFKASGGYDRWKKRFNADPKTKERKRAYKASAKGAKNARDYVRIKGQTDPAFKMLYRLRNRLFCALKRTRTSRPSDTTTKRLIGVPLDEALESLIRTVPPGMTFDECHIDHEIPCSFFDLSDPDQVRQCFHISNLRCLSPEENIRKGDKLPLTLEAALEFSGMQGI